MKTNIPLLTTLSLLLFNIAANCKQPSDTLKTIPSFETYCRSIIPNEEVEAFELQWPSDNLLCEGYNGSEGEMRYIIYRLKQSKKIVCVSEEGAYCQGDSDYGYEYIFDKDGHAIYSWKGRNPYVGTTIQFYDSGKVVAEVSYSPEADNLHRREIKRISSSEVINAKEFEEKIDEYKLKMLERLDTLRKLNLTKPEEKKEKESIIQSLQESLNKKVAYKNDYIYRKAKPIEKGKHGEATLVNSANINVRTTPNSSSPIIAKVSYYDYYIEVIDIGPAETIQLYGSHPWYKIQFMDMTTGKYIQGWIYGVFLVEGIYKK